MWHFIERKLTQLVIRYIKSQHRKIDFAELAPDTIIWFQPTNEIKITLTNRQDVNRVIEIISEWEWYAYWHTIPGFPPRTGIDLQRNGEALFRFVPTPMHTYAFIPGTHYDRNRNYNIADIAEGEMEKVLAIFEVQGNIADYD